MKNILINIICRKKAKEEHVADVIDKCYSENYNIFINICDYTLHHNIKDMNIINVDEDNKFNVTYHQLDMEDAPDHSSNLIEFMGDKQYDIVLDLESTLELENNFLNELELECLEDDNYGSTYCDFYSKTKTGHKIHIHQKSFPLINNSLPVVAFSVKNYIKYAGSENAKGEVLSNMIARHVPKALCSVINA